MRYSVVPAALPVALRRSCITALGGAMLAAGLLVLPATAVHAAPCAPENTTCAPIPAEPEPTQPSLAPEADKTQPSPKPEPTRVRETQVAPAPTAVAPRPVVSQAPVTVVPQTTTVESPSAEATSATPSASPSTSPSVTPSTASPGPSKSSNWDTPIDKKQATQAAVLASTSGDGPNMLGLFALCGGVLVVGLGGLAFALWSRNRLSSH
ncbi:hypothetical protein ACIQC5_06695 [Paenarthrobacter sp. NPDC092416]|uniref:hypothetical protein n=1 Tax=Paenarthrobacter sp. NPDC092416 TaxID=3364386 RepID=UPI00380F39CE